MVGIKLLVLAAGAGLFIFGLCAHIWVKIKLRPGERSSLENFHWEFEERHPDLARYNKWSQLTFTAAALGALLVFAGILI
jgi:hypothetical protein